MTSDTERLRREHRTRIARLQQVMRRENLDALLLANGPNLFYFTGFPASRAGARPYLLVLPQQGAPTFFLHGGREKETRTLTAVADVHTYQGLSRAPVLTAATLLTDRAYRRVGLEMGSEHYLDLQVQDLLLLHQAAAEIELVDAGDLLWELRMVKSDYEIECLRAACRITAQAYEEVFEAITLNMTESEIESRMMTAMIALGGRNPWVLITSGSGNYEMVSKGGTERRVAPGDMVWMDAGCSVNGYYADFSRAGVIHGPSSQQLLAQQQIREATLAGLQAIRVGAPVSDIAYACARVLDDLPFTVTMRISDLAGRVGHGMGLVITEWPHLDQANPLLIQPGMALTVEPGVATLYGTFHVEENVIVTASGYELLSTCAWELRTVG